MRDFKFGMRNYELHSILDSDFERHCNRLRFFYEKSNIQS